MKNTIFVVSLFLSSAVIADDCKTDITPDNGTAYILSQATVERVGVRGAKVISRMTSGTCSHDFYFDDTNKNMLAVLLTAKATGTKVKAYFVADAYSPDFVWGGGTVATHILSAIDAE